MGGTAVEPAHFGGGWWLFGLDWLTYSPVGLLDRYQQCDSCSERVSPPSSHPAERTYETKSEYVQQELCCRRKQSGSRPELHWCLHCCVVRLHVQ